ncbi:MAG: IS21 family transposase [Candidatus Thiodiazotropha sp. (ex Lucinoma borealis)]|nr:IS21 family transposase [Candidatus Thiodiazotropha sp. (ex Lucinoma borealis)]
MNKHREALRLILTTYMSNRMIGRTLHLSHNTVIKYRKRVTESALDTKTLNLMSDTEIEGLFKSKRFRVESKFMPDWAAVHKEMQCRDVTLQILWEDYRIENPGHAYGYSQYTYYYRKYLGKLDISMRQTHRAGETIYIDFAGRTVPYTDSETGEEYKAQVFVATLGCSNYSFVYAVRSQSLHDWITAHVQMFKYFGGVSQILIPDNLKAAVTKAGRDPKLNRTYLELARYYNAVVIPARVRHPKDKALAENMVRLVSRWILAALRHQRFFSIAEINRAIETLLQKLNERPFKRLPGSRLTRFEELDKPLLQPLPDKPFEYAEWTSAHKIGPDYHMRVKGHYYSVPHPLIGGKVEARVTSNIVELYHQGKRVASHQRSNDIGAHTTDPAHQPSSHRHYAEQTPELILKWASTIGPATEAVVKYQFESRVHDLLAIRSCSPLQRLAKEYGKERFEAACRRAQQIESLTTKSVRSILQHHLEDLSEEPIPVQVNLPFHENLRGPDYYVTGG